MNSNSLWNSLWHPAFWFARKVDTLSFGASMTLLALAALLSVLGMDWEDRMRGNGYRSALLDWKDEALKCAAFVFLMLTAFFWLTLLTKGVAALLGEQTPIEKLFCLIGVGAFPRFLTWMTYPLRSWNRRAYRFWQGFAMVTFVGMTALVGLALHVGLHLVWWKTALMMLPVVGASWSFGIWEVFFQEPTSYLLAYPWQQAQGARVLVFYPQGKNATEIAEIVRGCDRTLEQAASLLQVEPVDFRVHVFLFSDSALHDKVTKETLWKNAAYAHGDGISLVYETWERIAGTVAHEMTHVLSENRITPKMLRLLDEGLAEYVQDRLVPFSENTKPALSSKTPLYMLAHHWVFYFGRSLWHPEGEDWSWVISQHYRHAHAFVLFLINCYGLEKFKQLCRETTKIRSKDAGERLARAVHTIYQVSITDLEKEWRRAAPYEERLSPSRDRHHAKST